MSAGNPRSRGLMGIEDKSGPRTTPRGSRVPARLHVSAVPAASFMPQQHYVTQSPGLVLRAGKRGQGWVITGHACPVRPPVARSAPNALDAVTSRPENKECRTKARPRVAPSPKVSPPPHTLAKRPFSEWNSIIC